MSGSYRKAYDRVLPHALQVADPFHVIRLANQRLDDLRRRVQNETLGHRGRKDDPLYRIRRLLTAAHERISDRGQTRLRGLLDAGDPHGEVRTAWHATETVRGIYGIDSPVLALRYTLQLADDLQHESCPPEINKLGRTIARWTPQITNWHISKVTNRRHRSPQQPHQTDQTSSVRVTQLRELPNPGTALRRETQLGPTRHRHSPLRCDEPYNPGSVATYAREEFGVNDPAEQLEEEYRAAAQQRLAAAWLAEQGSRPDDDQQEDSRAAAVAGFGIVSEDAEGIVAAYDTRHRAAAAASVEQLLADGTPRVQVLQQTIEDWDGTRYIGAALETLAALEPGPPTQEQKTPQRRRGGSGLSL